MREDEQEKLEAVYTAFRKEFFALVTKYENVLKFNGIAASLGGLVGSLLAASLKSENPEAAIASLFDSLSSTFRNNAGLDERNVFKANNLE